jgi:hypothetical protein
VRWVTREDVKVGRMACSWLIERFVDPEAEILYVPRTEVREIVEREGAIPFHVPGSELAHNAKGTSFEAILNKYNLLKDPALALMGKIINGADTDNRRYNQPEGPGVRAIADGFRYLGFPNDRERVARASIVFDALYAYCRHEVESEGS